MHRKSVDFPQPEGPMIAVIFLSGILTLTPFRASVLPKNALRLLTSNFGCPLAGGISLLISSTPCIWPSSVTVIVKYYSTTVMNFPLVRAFTERFRANTTKMSTSEAPQALSCQSLNGDIP